MIGDKLTYQGIDDNHTFHRVTFSALIFNVILSSAFSPNAISTCDNRMQQRIVIIGPKLLLTIDPSDIGLPFGYGHFVRFSADSDDTNCKIKHNQSIDHMAMAMPKMASPMVSQQMHTVERGCEPLAAAVGSICV